LQQWIYTLTITTIIIIIITTIIPNTFLKIVLTPQFTEEKFKVVNPARIPVFLLERARSRDNGNSIKISLILWERGYEANL